MQRSRNGEPTASISSHSWRRREAPRQATSRVMCQGERGAYSLCFVFVDEDGEEDAVH